MDLNISDSTDESYVFVGPVTQRELILTWKKRRQLKLEQEREKAESHNALESSDEVLPSDVREPTKGENDDHRNIAESSLPFDDPSVNSPFSSSSAVEVATIERITPEKIEEPIRGINVEVAPCVPEAPSPEKACDVVSPKDPLASPRADVRNNIVSPECANEGDEMAAEPVPPSTVMAGNMIQGEPVSLLAVEVATIERITPEKIEEPVRGINVEVAPCVPEAPSPEKPCDVVSPKDPPASSPADVRNNNVSPECANEGVEMAAEPVPPSTVTAGNMIQGEPVSQLAVEVATIERITPEKIEEPVRGINVEVAPCVPEAPSPEKACDVVSPKDPLASPPVDVRNNIVSPECANEGDEMAAEPVPPSTVTAGNMIQGEAINLSSSILGVETDLPTRESIEFSTDNFQENTHSVCDEDDDSSDSFEDASEEFVITMSKKGRSPISTQMIEVLPVVSDQASLEDHLGVTLDPDELSGLLDQFEISNIGLRGANKEGRPSIKDSEPQSPSSTDVSLQGLENDILLALDETPRSQRDHHAAKRISCTNDASESDVDSPELTVSSPAQEDTHGQDHTDATRHGSPTNPQTVAHPTPLLLPPVELKSAPPRTSESFDDSSTESASIPPTRNILRPPKFVVPSTFDGGWGKKLKLKPSNKPKRPAYVQPLNNHEL